MVPVVHVYRPLAEQCHFDESFDRLEDYLMRLQTKDKTRKRKNDEYKCSSKRKRDCHDTRV